MSCGIYKITNLINNKSYIGQSIYIENRWNKEKVRAFSVESSEYNKTLSQAFRKYGIENFSFEIIEECEKEELNEKEQYYINFYNTYFDGYNETTGGQSGNNNYSMKISKENLLEIYNLLMNTDIPQKDIAEKFNVGQDVISTINHGKSRRLDGYVYPLRQSKKYYCCDCGIEISKQALRCDKCNKIQQRKVERPTKEELKNLIRINSFLQIGKKYGVADNTIKKWCIAYNLPSKKSIINQYTNEEWELV